MSPYRAEVTRSAELCRRSCLRLCYLGKSRPREVRAADQHLIGNHPIEQLAAGGLGHLAVLVERSMPLRVPGAERGHVSGIVGDHQLRAAGGQVEGGMARRVTGCFDKEDAG